MPGPPHDPTPGNDPGSRALRARLEVLSGGRAGSRFHLDPARSHTVGRSPRVSIPLDAEVDLDVSREHALLQFERDGWTLRDLDSRNGTWLNDVRVGETGTLADGDRIRFGGPGAPEARFRMGETDTSRLRTQGRRRAWTLGVGAALALLLVTATSLLLIRSEREDRARWEANRAQLESTVDSLLERDARAAGILDELDEALETSRTEVTRLRSELRTRDNSEGRVRSTELESLRRELEEATQALGRQQLAASLDFEAIEESARRTVVQVFVESADGQVVTGTGFAISPDALVVTARHLLEADPSGAPPTRIAIQFADSRQIWAADEVARSGEADLALLRAPSIGSEVPHLREVTRGLPTPGDPVAIVGFPLGTTPDPRIPETDRPAARPLISAGVVGEVSDAEIMVQGWGEPGASGSPVLDEAGRVVGVVMGGERTARGGQIVVVPTPRLHQLLEAAGQGAADQRAALRP